MSVDIVDTKTGEVVAEAATPAQALAIVPKDDMLALIKDNDKGVYKAMERLSSLDWRNLKPNETALLLMQKPFPVSGGGSMTLNFKQALLFAVRCYELELSPFSDNVWFDPGKSSVSVTLSGKRELARIKGLDLGPPSFEDVSREWKDVARSTPAVEEVKKAGFAKDIGVKCKMRVGDPKHKEFAEYTAYLSEWYVPRSPVWQSKPLHMLQTRATEKAISLAMGTGASSGVGAEPDGE